MYNTLYLDVGTVSGFSRVHSTTEYGYLFSSGLRGQRSLYIVIQATKLCKCDRSKMITRQS